MTLVTSMREAARQIGVSHTAIQRAERAGRIARSPCGGWDVAAIRGQFVPPTAATRPSAREMARQIGISHVALQKAERNGRVKREPDGSWDIEKVRAGLKTRAAPTPRAPHGSRGPWAKPAQYFAKLDTDIIGPIRNIHTELEAARRALQRAAEQIAALYPEILRLERACDAAIAAQERGSE